MIADGKNENATLENPNARLNMWYQTTEGRETKKYGKKTVWVENVG